MLDLETLTTPTADRVLFWFAETTVVAIVLAAIATIAGRIRWLSPGPAARHALWLLVLLKLMAPPLIFWPWSIASLIPAVKAEAIPAALGSVKSSLFVEEIDEPKMDPDLSPVPRTIEAALVISPPTSPTSWIFVAWVVGSITLGAGQLRRIVRFRRLLREANPAPDWLQDEADWVANRLRVRVPEIRVVRRLGTPLVWCLGRPVLLIPASLLKSIESNRWRAILAHELAHLRRGDHWVRRLELVAGLIWWWSPVYWLARRRIDLEAEMASDAWVLWASPEDRIGYAESLLRICTTLSPVGLPSPSMGVAGSGLFFERRLTMILRNQGDRRVPIQGLAAAFLLVGLALPSWSLAEPVGPGDEIISIVDVTPRPNPEISDPVVMDIRVDVIALDDDEDEADSDKKKVVKDKAKQDELLKKMEAMGQKLGKEMEAKFGPGSEFAKQMESMNKDMEARFGPGSEFAKKMEAMGKEMEAKFGPGSEFAKQMEAGTAEGRDEAKKARDEARKTRLKVEGDARKAKLKADADARKVKLEARVVKEKAERDPITVRVKTDRSADPRARRIEALESRIDDMMKELKRLKAESKDEDKKDEEG